jgi:hypothetical protein
MNELRRYIRFIHPYIWSLLSQELVELNQCPLRIKRLLPHLDHCSACHRVSPFRNEIFHAMETLRYAFEEYWGQQLLNALEYVLGLDVRISTKRTKREYTREDICQQLLKVDFVRVRSRSGYGRKQWAEFSKRKLWEFFRAGQSISMLLSSKCALQYPELLGDRLDDGHRVFGLGMSLGFCMSYAEMTNAGITVEPGLYKWRDEAVALLDSKFPVLDLGLRNQVCIDRDTDSQVFTLTCRL